MEKRVVFSQVECTAVGVIQIRLDKQVVDGDQVIAHEYHRTSLQPGEDLDAQMGAVTAHLAAMAFPAPAVDDLERIRRIVQVEHTPTRIAAFQDAVVKAREATAAALTPRAAAPPTP
jgi:hypothetical protein